MASRLLFFVVLLGLLSFVPLSNGQFKFREPPNRQDPAELDARSGDAIWSRFLSGRAIGEFQMYGKLSYRPRGEESVRFGMILDGNWQLEEQLTGVQLTEESGEKTSAILKTTADGSLFVKKSSPAEDLSQSDWLNYAELPLEEKLWGELPLSYFDLAMSYLSWEKRLYVGSERFLGRPAHAFRLINPDTEGRISEVEVLIDEDYAALLSVKLYDRTGKLVERLRIGGFKQFGEFWAFSELIWEKREKRESLKLEVDDLVVRP